MTVPLPLFDGAQPLETPIGAPSAIRPAPGWPFEPLQMFGYDVIMADPPWRFELYADSGTAKSAQAHYDCMTTDAIAALPVDQLARGDSWLWLWATFPMLPDALAVMRRWGFTYVTGGPWIKRGRSGKLAMGPGYVLRTCSELFLLGRFGKPPTCSRSTRNLIEAPRREHSRKPDEAYAVAETLFGPARRADLFARQSRPGWEAWGHQATKFDGGQAAMTSSTVGADNRPSWNLSQILTGRIST